MRILVSVVVWRGKRSGVVSEMMKDSILLRSVSQYGRILTAMDFANGSLTRNRIIPILFPFSPSVNIIPFYFPMST